MISGFLLVNKDPGISSSRVVQVLKKKLNLNKVGHLGTLDPMATGLLIIAINRATKFASLLLQSEKSYRAEVTLGIQTDTDDAEGEAISLKDINIDEYEAKKALLTFLGESDQLPPSYSALKYKGKRLYKIARSGRTVDRSPRKITIYSIDVTNIAKDSIRFTVHCSKGTYIRVLVEDIAKSAGMLAYTSFLRRVRIGQFDQFRMIEFDELKSKFIEYNESLDEHLIPIEHALFNFQNIELSHIQAKKFLNGQRLHCNLSGSGHIKVFDQDKNLLGIATQVDNSVIAAKRIFHL